MTCHEDMCLGELSVTSDGDVPSEVDGRRPLMKRVVEMNAVRTVVLSLPSCTDLPAIRFDVDDLSTLSSVPGPPRDKACVSEASVAAVLKNFPSQLYSGREASLMSLTSKS